MTIRMERAKPAPAKGTLAEQAPLETERAETERMTVSTVAKPSSGRNTAELDSLLNVALDVASAGYWSYDIARNHFQFSDSVLARLTESEQARIAETGLWCIMERDDLPRVMAEWTRALQGGGDRLNLTYRVTTQTDGTMWQNSVGRIERNSRGTPIRLTAFVRDITEDVERQEELVRARESESAKTEFLARMSHEIRTPLNAIIGLCDLLLEDDAFGHSEEVRDILSDIDSAAVGLQHLLNQTLDHTKLVAHKVELELDTVEIGEVVREVSGLWAPQARLKGVAFSAAAAHDMPARIRLDPFRLKQCVNNVVSNAVKFTESGAVGVQFGHEPSHDGSGDGADAGTLVLKVSDTGIGMDADAIARLHEPFEQAETSTTRRFGGTGLGMTITHQLIELMGGTLAVESVPGSGSTFTLRFPLAASEQAVSGQAVSGQAASDRPAGAQFDTGAGAASPDAPPIALPVAPPAMPPAATGPEAVRAPTLDTDRANAHHTAGKSARFAGLRVLCVEDNPANRRLVDRLLRDVVGHLVFATNGEEALAALEEHEFDVILMDVHMPVMDGIEATIAIRNSSKAYAKVVIIALTADSDYQHRRVCRNLGMNDTIAKPVRRREILEAFARNLDALAEVYGQDIPLAV